ncbi:hypothetical protein [Marinivivus vitaminiproducens]|uniref:hypothetical protein n=1 Tax=Marinivivus vitaminiproducens TaxID=3035935 RepID=UPI00279EBFF8|nr:hypothetical protein P4R82_10830 [Geminicoccaceae bacterium SCSIO 64248]
MIALLDDCALVEHDDPVRVADRPQAMGDDDHRPAMDQLADRRLQHPFVLNVERHGNSRLAAWPDDRLSRCAAAPSAVWDGSVPILWSKKRLCLEMFIYCAYCRH